MASINSFAELNEAKGFKLAHLNIRSIIKKIDQVRLCLQDAKLDVFSVSETWMRPHLGTQLVELQGFQTYRLDRKGSAKKKRGGGLLTYVSDKHAVNCEMLEHLDRSSEDIEVQWILIRRPHCKNVIACNVYRPPSGNLHKAIQYLEECVKTLNLSKVNMFMLGDLNINYKNKSSVAYKKLHFFSQSNGFTQYINSTTRNTDKSKSLIDLALTNSKFVSNSGTLEHYISDHQPIFIIHKKGRDTRKTVQFQGRSYRTYDKDVFKKKLLEGDWDTVYRSSTPDQAWAYILGNVTAVLDGMCPLRRFKIKNYKPEWMTNELIEQVKDRDYFYHRAKTTGDRDYWNIAKYLRNITNSRIRQAKREFVLAELQMHQNDAKKFWKVINDVIPTGKKTASNDILLKHGDKYLDKGKVAHYINDYFVNVGNVQLPGKEHNSGIGENPTPIQTNTSLDLKKDSEDTEGDKFRLSRIRETDVYKVVKEINVSKSSGLDGISSFIIKEAFQILIREVTIMMNLSVETSIFPSVWKEALVIPIPKSGNLTQVKNYRPISLLPIPGKILEKLVHSQLSMHLENNHLLSDDQHGFRRNHSTVHSIAQFTNYVNTKLDNGLPTLVTYIDFRKAFDCVQHSVLLTKLGKLNMDVATIEWAKSYLESRKQRVLANGVYSSHLPITQGVPQGSVLGPLFYIIYANDLPDIASNCNVAMYADDTILYTANRDFGRSVKKMQEDLNSLSRWCLTNGISMNVDKTKIMTFGRPKMINDLQPYEIMLNEIPIQRVTSYKYLGITLDSQLNYKLHASKIIANASGKLKQFQRMRNFLDTRSATLVYKSMLLPLLEYGDIFLSATTVQNRKKLQVLQNKGLRCALNKGIDTSTDELHDEAKLHKLKFRREQHLLNFMYDWAKDSTKLKVKSTYSIKTRSHNKRMLFVKRPKTESFKRSFAYQGPRKWNRLAEAFHQAATKESYKLLIGGMIGRKVLRQDLSQISFQGLAGSELGGNEVRSRI